MQVKKELASIEAQIEKSKQPYAETVCRLASVEVLEHNRKDLERLLDNEESAREKAQNRTLICLESVKIKVVNYTFYRRKNSYLR